MANNVNPRKIIADTIRSAAMDPAAGFPAEAGVTAVEADPTNPYAFRVVVGAKVFRVLVKEQA